MTKFRIRCNFNASYEVEVMANDEGEALEKATNMAEDADNREFVIYGQGESQIIAREDIY